MEQHSFQLLEAINKNTNLNQKKMAEICSISIGKVNYLIHDLTIGNYIYSEKKGRNISYYLTQKGIDFLQSGIEAFREKKVNIHQEPVTEIKQAVILAAGTRKDFAKPAGLMPIEGTTLLKRNIDILKENGIEDIVIVTGYQREAFQEVSEFSHYRLVENPKYKWTGSMASLALAHEQITDDFLLIEDDILIEERAIKELLTHPQRDCVLIANESGSGDEAFVEIKNGYLHKISKDIHQFNHVDGELIGVSKLSYEVFTKMVNEFQENNNNPYMNYEYMLLDVSRHYNIAYLKMHNLVWGEIDSQLHYDTIINKTFPILQRKEAEFRDIQIKGYLMEALDITLEDIREIQPFGGMTNKNFKVLVHDKEYVLRIPGNGTEQMINRKEEKVNSSLASEMGIDTELIYFNEETGVKIAELIQEAETLNPKTAKRQDYMKLTTAILRKLHYSDVKMANRFDVFEKINDYELLMTEAKGQPYEGYEEVKAQVMALKEIYQGMNITLTPCHNDLVAENFVKSGSGKIYLIDWEYSGMNDPMWDVAAHSLECDFSPEEEELFLTLYLNENQIPLELQQRVLMNKIYQDFLWCIWTIIKEAKGDDFGTYGTDRFNRARNNLANDLIKEMTYEYKK
ncbi:NTP transferase domain-containing protein [Neobacillus ginsengisoli]|uniref:Thiamine kinase-like enzyme/choline kinase/predicted transcriptional regulator n=1 Tax=Neobacillus ginsengisoli TaxID=904295 RepID=A0ABT9XUZ7_9BACI|nr:NTP transferase domain-containing protein [Neobacillus ginsengisoli]MDQ0199080.1 thiamine kinase-like enzyme/choline kinase/predicted transcriptional regulator [Neobacillus ginsengisoli]